MGGKAAILLVLGFGLIFLIVESNFNKLSVRAVENSTEYYSRTVAHNIAVSGINLALNKIFIDNSWSEGFSELDYEGGKINVDITDNYDLINVKSTGTYGNAEKLLIVKLQPSSYAKFGWYIQNMSSKIFTTGDTVYGPFHSQSTLNIDGDPVFFGKVTTLHGFNPDPKHWASRGYDPKFYGGLETGVDIPLENNYDFADQKAAALDAMNNFGGSCYFANTDLWLKLNGNGTITYRTGNGADTSLYSQPITLPLAEMAPTGLIYLSLGNVYLSGELNGQLSIVAGESSGLGNGNIYLYDDVTYVDAPMVYEGNNQYAPTSSDDMLGLMSSNNLIISDTIPNENDIRIDASVFCAHGGVQAENINTISNHGKIYVRGGVIAAKEENVVKIENDGTFKGFKKHVIYDERFLLKSPPLFPRTDNFEIVSWYE